MRSSLLGLRARIFSTFARFFNVSVSRSLKQRLQQFLSPRVCVLYPLRTLGQFSCLCFSVSFVSLVQRTCLTFSGWLLKMQGWTVCH